MRVIPPIRSATGRGTTNTTEPVPSLSDQTFIARTCPVHNMAPIPSGCSASRRNRFRNRTFPLQPLPCFPVTTDTIFQSGFFHRSPQRESNPHLPAYKNRCLTVLDDAGLGTTGTGSAKWERIATLLAGFPWRGPVPSSMLIESTDGRTNPPTPFVWRRRSRIPSRRSVCNTDTPVDGALRMVDNNERTPLG